MTYTAPTSQTEGRAVLPHKDPTFDMVWDLMQQGDPATDWRITGPKLVTQYGRTRGLARAGDGHGKLEAIPLPISSSEPVTINLQPDVARAVLTLLHDVAEPVSSRSGSTVTYRLKDRGTPWQ